MASEGNTIKGKTDVNRMVLTALFAAVIAVASWIAVPLPFTPVPINMATLAVTVTGALLGHKYGTLSVVIYILLGAAGVPVFAGFTGGLGHIAGPTGGYIIGYAASAFLCALIIELFCKKELKWYYIVLASLVGTASCYVLGTIWFMALTSTGFIASLSLCVIPFIPGDIFKTIVAVLLVKALKPKLDHLR